MRYISTRGGDIAETAADAIRNGIARDGGLYVPENIPAFTEAEAEELRHADYSETATAVFRKFLSGYSVEDILTCSVAPYKDTFDQNTVAPLYRLDDRTRVLELWHGPTSAFKDVALQALPYLITCAQRRAGGNSKVAILVATSGDTGKAALEGFRDIEGTSVTVLYPKDGVSDMQKRQMQTQRGGNVSVVAIEGNFDDAQSAVKAIFADERFCTTLSKNGVILSSANSINWGRLLPQIVYYVYTAFRCSERTDFIVPTGNFGNILACWYAKRMGAPIGTLVCASNRNDVLTDFLQTGTYDSARELYKTLSPSMDILVSSNLERLLFELSGHDARCVSDRMEQLKTCGAYSVEADILRAIKAEFCAFRCDDAETLSEIRRVYEEHHYLVDPHTAVAMHAWRAYRAECPETNCVIVSTASPYKFPDDVYRAVANETNENLDAFTAMNRLSAWTDTEVPKPLGELFTLPCLHTDSCTKQEIIPFIEQKILSSD